MELCGRVGGFVLRAWVGGGGGCGSNMKAPSSGPGMAHSKCYAARGLALREKAFLVAAPLL